MTKLATGDGGRGSGRCRWCRRPLPERHGPGRPRRFCSGRCRQAEWVHARRSAELALSEHELVVARTELEELYDDLYVLQCAIDDVHADLALVATPTSNDLHDALRWVVSAAAPLRDRAVQPATPVPAAERP